MLARDASNYTIEFTPELIQSWRNEGVGLVILQAFPPSYTAKYAEQRRQMRVCAQEGMPFDCYVYDYLGDPTWLSGALDGLEQALLPSEKPRKVWLDEEDVETETGWSQSARAAAIEASVQEVQRRGYPVGIYSAAWWWVGRVAFSNVTRALPLWAAQYDNIPDATVFTPFGGWSSCSIKQYADSQPDGTDRNVLSVQEEAELSSGGGGDVPDIDAAWQAKKDLVVTAAGELLSVADQIKAEANRKGGPRVTVVRKLAEQEVRPRAQKILA